VCVVVESSISTLYLFLLIWLENTLYRSSLKYCYRLCRLLHGLLTRDGSTILTVTDRTLDCCS
jgi:hypothetical protein